jgi:hypothetical protein
MFRDNPQADHQPNQQEARQSSPFAPGAEVTERAAETAAEAEVTGCSVPATKGSSAPETAATPSELASMPLSDRVQASGAEVSPDSPSAEEEPFGRAPEKSAAPAPAGAISRRVAANRANAKKSTGPRTARGKAISRFNATRHGLLARKLANGNGQPLEEGLEAVMEGLREKYGTGDITVELLLETTVVDYYRTAKALEHENRIFSTRWSFAQQGEMPCLQRYVTASRNALLKDLQLLEQLRARQVESASEVKGGDCEDVSSDPAGEVGTDD